MSVFRAYLITALFFTAVLYLLSVYQGPPEFKSLAELALFVEFGILFILNLRNPNNKRKNRK